MSYTDVISMMKKSSFEDALSVRVLVTDRAQNFVGYLVPVGEWILLEESKIELIQSWRQRTMKMFLTQFESTFEKTLAYLKNLSIEQKCRILFLLYDDSDRFVGHIGIANVDGSKGELDNLMRGLDGGHSRLIYLAEVAFLNWCFRNLGISETDVRVLSYNWLVLSLHEEVGYKFVENIPLKKVCKDGIIFHDFTSSEDSNVKYQCTKMLLKKEVFFELNGWLSEK